MDSSDDDVRPVLCLDKDARNIDSNNAQAKHDHSSHEPDRHDQGGPARGSVVDEFLQDDKNADRKGYERYGHTEHDHEVEWNGAERGNAIDERCQPQRRRVAASRPMPLGDGNADLAKS